MPVLSALRAATADLHDSIEADADIEARLRDLDTRPATVARFLALHVAVEDAVRPWAGEIADAGYPLRPRSDVIRSDLDRLGRPAPDLATSAPLKSLGEALGWIYVAEGSMLGGRVMRRSMTADGVPLTGLEFLDPYADETGTRWRAFLNVMESVCAAGRATQEDVVRGGRDAFRLARTVLVSPRPAGIDA